MINIPSIHLFSQMFYSMPPVETIEVMSRYWQDAHRTLRKTTTTAGRVAVAGPLLMAEEGSDEKITITSGTREIAYDAKSRRFFETNLQEEECIPDEEYCVVDPESGELIRLTVAEKERIFLDALQSYYATGRQAQG